MGMEYPSSLIGAQMVNLVGLRIRPQTSMEMDAETQLRMMMIMATASQILSILIAMV